MNSGSLLGCLHPHRHPPEESAKYGRAFIIFKRVEERLNPSKRALRRNECFRS
jgi:hypothetical protein